MKIGTILAVLVAALFVLIVVTWIFGRQFIYADSCLDRGGAMAADGKCDFSSTVKGSAKSIGEVR